MDILYHYTYYVHGYFYDIQDERTRSYPFVMLHPATFAFIMLVYFLAVTKIGPAWMKDRPPFQLRGTMFVYNVAMVCVNVVAFVVAVRRSDYLRRLVVFEYPDRSDTSPQALYEIHLGWWYWMSKFVDWGDTFFFVLRKKNEHINFLHLYHHISVLVLGYLLIKINPFLPGLHLFIILNTFVHFCMFSYYALAALGPKVQRWLWWKRYITVIELGQFFILFIYAVLLFCYQTGYPPIWLYVGLTQPPFFFWMFYSFYKQTYSIKGKGTESNGGQKELTEKGAKGIKKE